jgi:hypothetical protein
VALAVAPEGRVLEPARSGARRLMQGSQWRHAGSAIAAIGVVALAIGVIVGAGAPGSSKGASGASSNGSGVATVQRRDLIATDTEPGTLGYANPQPVFNRISGTLTYLPTVGATIKPGQALYDVDGSPIVLMDGTVPAFRTLTSGVSNGPDVTELNRNVVTLGFDPSHQITVNDTWQAGTTAAVEAWQASLGQTQTGTVTLGQVVFLPGVRRIDSVTGVLGSTGGGGAGAGSSSAGTTTGASLTVTPTASSVPVSASAPGQARAEYVSFTTTAAAPASTPATTTTAVARASTPATTAATTAPPPAIHAAQAPACTEPGTTTAATTTPATPCPTATTTTPATTTTTPAKPSGKGSPTAQQLLAQLVAELKKLASGGSRTGTTGTSGSTGSSGRTSAGATGGASRGGGSGAGAAAASAGSASGGGGSGGGSSSSAAGSSAAGATATEVLDTTSADLVVTVQLDATKQSEAVVGEPVTVQLPDGSTQPGKITAVSPVAQSTSSSSSSTAAASGGGGGSSTPSATVPVTIALLGNHHVAGLDQAAVSVNFQQQVERGVLSVPVTALLATPGGGYAVQTVNQAGVHKLVPVSPGLFAGGFVQVSGSDLVEGMQVTDSQG